MQTGRRKLQTAGDNLKSGSLIGKQNSRLNTRSRIILQSVLQPQAASIENGAKIELKGV